ncbi:reverse transcriptase domain-containing protein [Tanacetum coccineum]
MEIRSLGIFAYSQLMVNQIKGLFEARQPATKQYLERVKEILKGFDTYTMHIRRNQNKKTYSLSKLASMTFEHLMKEVLVEVLAKRSINDKDVSRIEAKKEVNWMTPIYEYLLSDLLPKDSKEAKKIRIRAPLCNLSPLQPPSRVNVEIMNHIEKQLVQSQQGWADDLARVLWVHRTLPRNSQNETSFALTYGSEAIIPSAVSFIPESEEHTIKAKRKEVEEREVASIEEANYRNKLRRYHNLRSNRSTFKLGDFVLLSLRNKMVNSVARASHHKWSIRRRTLQDRRCI